MWRVITPLGILAGIALLLAAASRIRPISVFAASAGLTIGCSVIVGGESVTVFYTLALGFAAHLGYAWFSGRRTIWRSTSLHLLPEQDRWYALPGAPVLLFFGMWCALITLVGPTLFRGYPVLVPRGGIDAQVQDPGTLDYTVSNFAQLLYLLLGLATILVVARARAPVGQLVGIALGLQAALVFWRLLSVNTGVPFPEGFFDNSTNVHFIESTSTGETRFRGIMAEPSSLGEGSLATVAYFAARVPLARGGGRLLSMVLVVMAVISGLLSTSAAFVAAGLVCAAVALVVAFVGFTLRRSAVSPLLALVICGSVVMAAVSYREVLRLVGQVASEKVGSSSYHSRSGADLFSLNLTLDTWGLGTGLGSNRPSSMIAALLSCVGVPGTLALFAFMTIMVTANWHRRLLRPTIWALVAIVVSKIVAGPTTLEPIPALCLGVLAHAAWRARPLLGPIAEPRQTLGSPEDRALTGGLLR